MLWPSLLNAWRLAIRPTRVVLAMVLILLVALLWWLPTLWLEKDATPSYSVSVLSSQAFDSILLGMRRLDLGPIADGVKQLLVDLPFFLVRHHPWSIALLSVPTLLLWAVLGGAITRSAAEEFSLNKRSSITASLAFSLSRLWSFFFAPVVPLALAGGLTLGIMGLGYILLRVPGLNIAGGMAFGLPLLLGCFLLIVFLVLMIGSGLLLPAVACEGVDAIDATQRTFAYSLSRPIRTITYLLIVLVQGLVIAAVLTFLVKNAVHLTSQFAVAWLPDATRDVVHSAATTRHAVIEEGSPFGTGTMASMVALWCAIPGLIAGSILVSFVCCGTTIMYLLLRQACDGQDPADLWMPGTVAGTIAPAPVAVSAEEPEER
jgi:hypothetical protein